MILNKSSRVLTTLIVVSFVLLPAANAFPYGDDDPPFGLSPEQIREMAEMYAGEPAPAQVAYWKTLMPVLPDRDAVRQAALKDKDVHVWMKYELRDQQLVSNLTKVISPVTSLYDKQYRIIVVEFNKPVIIIESDSLLIISTELLRRVRQSDDELLGLVAHEAAHSIFTQKSLVLKKMLGQKNQEAVAIKNLAAIEVSCDFIAARTMLALGKDPLAFLRLNQAIENAYPRSRDASPFYPSAAFRLTHTATVAADPSRTPELSVSKKAVDTALLRWPR